MAHATLENVDGREAACGAGLAPAPIRSQSPAGQRPASEALLRRFPPIGGGAEFENTRVAKPELGIEKPAAVRAGQEPEPAQRAWAEGLDGPTLAWLAVVHVGALAAPFFFTWQGLAAFCFLAWLTGSVGVCMGYHRLLTHGSFQTFRFMRRLFAVVGLLAGEGPPLTWVSVHRKHHRYSDRPGDPHSPRDGRWWSHMVWLFPRPREPHWTAMIERYGKDLLKDPFMRLLDATFIVWHLALGAALFGLGWACWDLRTGVSLLVWGMFLRLVWVLHATWAVNSASHIWGYRNYATPDDSRNLWWVGLVAFGEGWHNNHHAFPGRARHGHRWWEIDMTYAAICGLEKFGLAWKILRSRKVESPSHD